MNEIGGVSYRDVILFQTQIMMGTQFGRVMKGKDERDLAIACLRMGWNDAFRHTSQNVKVGEKAVLDDESAKWNKTHKESHDDFICGNILNQPSLQQAFYAFARGQTPEEKAAAIEEHFSEHSELSELFGRYKTLKGERKLSFGHFQKMFNIALKLYLCLYMCREYLGLGEDRFDRDLLPGLATADCPIDSIILGTLGENYKTFKWSQLKAEEYVAVQQEIRSQTEGASNLAYDFHNWER